MLLTKPPALNPSPNMTPSAMRINPKTNSAVFRESFGFLFSIVTRISPGIPKARPIAMVPATAPSAPAVPAKLERKMLLYFPIYF